MKYRFSYIPFLDEGDFRQQVAESVSLGKNVFYPKELKDLDSGVLPKQVKMIRIQPFNVLVFDEDDSVVAGIVKKGGKFDAIITDIDYSRVSYRLAVKSKGEEDLAVLQEGNDVQVEPLLNAEPLNMLLSGSFDNSSVTTGYKVGERVGIKDMGNNNPVSEARNYRDINRSRLSSTFNPLDEVYTQLDMYFRPDVNRDAFEKVPLLLGPTGVFKSSTVKELTEKYGYRLVDVRVAFTTKLDYSGLSEIIKSQITEEGLDILSLEYRQCPMEELFTCSDGFRHYCSKAIEVIKKTLSKGKLDKDKSQRLNHLLEQYQYYVKVPVLFFDEITRNTNATVEGVLIELLNKKSLGSMELKEALFVAASNFDYNSDDMNRLYDVQQNFDTAYPARFTPIAVLPESVQDRWLSWGSSENAKTGKMNMNQDVVAFLTEHRDLCYNVTEIQNALNSSDPDKSDPKTVSLMPFPNYRSWDFVSRYIDTCITKKVPILKQTIMGFVGESAAKELFKELKGKYDFIDVKKNIVTTFLENSLDTGTPAVIVGPTSLGKTSRVYNYAKKQANKPEIISVNLATRDRADMVGMPAKVRVSDFISKGVNLSDMPDLIESLEGLVSDVRKELPGFPDMVTAKARDKGAAETFRRAYESGKDIILFFDEVNRVTNPVIMSAVFDAISDCFVGSTKISMLDGRDLTIESLHNDIQCGKEMWVYSCDKDGRIVPGKVINSRKIENTDKRLVKVTLDNGESVVCTEDHRWMARDGQYKEAKNLCAGDSLMPLYKYVSSKSSGDLLEGYEMVKNNKTGNFVYTHQMVAYSLDMVKDKNVIHHVDFNKRNNDPNNFDCSMTVKEHVKFHGDNISKYRDLDRVGFEERRLAGYRKWMDNGGLEKLVNLAKTKLSSAEANMKKSVVRKRLCSESDEYRKSSAAALIRFNKETTDDGRRSEWMRSYWNRVKETEYGKERLSDFSKRGNESFVRKCKEDANFRENLSKKHKDRVKDDVEFKNRMKENAIKNNKNEAVKIKQRLGKIKNVVNECFSVYGVVNEEFYSIVKSKMLPKNMPTYGVALNILKDAGIKSFNELLEVYNHKVVCVESLNYTEPVYDIEVDRYHNFALSAGVFVHNCRVFGIEFDPNRVKVVLAANMGEVYTNAKKLDPALAARLSILWKKSYDMDDVDSFKEHLDSEVSSGKIHKVIADFYDKLDPDKALNYMKSIEEKTINKATAGTRDFKQLGLELKSMEGKGIYSGCLLFPSVDYLRMLEDFQKAVKVDDNKKAIKSFKDLYNKLLPRMGNWVCLGDNKAMPGDDLTPSELINDFKSTASKVVKGNPSDIKEVLGDLSIQMDLITRFEKTYGTTRVKIFKTHLGETAGADFGDYFNTVFGTSDYVVITIPMLVDDSLIDEFIKQQYVMSFDVFQSLAEFSFNILKEFYTEFSSSKSSQQFDNFLDKIIKATCANPDDVRSFFLLLPKDLLPMLLMVESSGADTIIKYVDACGVKGIDRNYIEGLDKSGGEKVDPTKDFI